jgi:hypothetical protein
MEGPGAGIQRSQDLFVALQLDAYDAGESRGCSHMNSKPPIDLLMTFARFGRQQRLSLRDPKAAEAFTGTVKEQLAEALGNEALLHGQRVQNMFEALVVSLGQYNLLKTEDTGTVHPQGKFTAPDFRVVLRDGAQWLIEVKNVHDADPGRQRFRIRTQDFDRLKAYAVEVNCPLKFALYWSQWRIWTLIDGDDLAPDGEKLTVDMFRATFVNQFAQLGDRIIGTTPPLKLRLAADTSKPRSVSPTGEVSFTIGRAILFSGDAEITDPVEQKITWILVQFGEWTGQEPKAVMNGNVLEGIEFEWTPSERANEDQNFEMIGTLSTMFSRHYAAETLDDGGVMQTEAELTPDWFAPLVATELRTAVLPLWRFVLQPHRDQNAKNSKVFV